MIDNWRTVVIFAFIFLSVIDLGLTYSYINKYKSWQPDKPYELMERNPLLIMLWNFFGLKIGTIIGGVIILTLIYIISKSAHWAIVLILGLLLLFTMYNHYVNINLLDKLILNYPSGHLPEEVFGKVIGNNIK